MIDAETRLYGVIGYPIKHSLSPKLHTSMFKYHGINAVYLAFEIKNIKQAIEAIRTLNIKGVNVTIPYKEDVLDLVDEIDSDAKKIQAINTIKNIDGKLMGYNTDYLGFMDMFKKNIKNYKNKTVTVIGAGGAAKAIVYALHKIGIESINLLNRTVKNAEKLKLNFHNLININISGLNDKNILSNSDVLINCTSVGLNNNKTPINMVYIDNSAIMDIIYKDSALIKEARKKHLAAINGVDMFIGQAFYSFKIFTNIEFNKKYAYDIIKGES